MYFPGECYIGDCMTLVGVIHVIIISQNINASLPAEGMLILSLLIDSRKRLSETRKPSEFPDLAF